MPFSFQPFIKTKEASGNAVRKEWVEYTSRRLLRVVLEIIDDIAHGQKRRKIRILENDIKFFFAQNDQIRKLKRIEAEIVYQFGIHGYVVGVYAHFLNKNFF